MKYERYFDVVSNDPMDYVRVALALETLAYHNKNYLDRRLYDNCTFSEEIQTLLTDAIKCKENAMSETASHK